MALFAGGKPVHSVAGSGYLQKLVAGLPADDSVKALTDITVGLDSVNRAEGLGLRRRFELIDLLDSTAQHHFHKLSDEYQSAQRLQQFEENTLWTAAFDFSKRLSDAYSRCVEELASDGGAAVQVRKEIPVFVARGLRALTLQLKWTLLRYDPIDTNVWAAVGRLYLVSETRGICTESVRIYPDAHGQGTVQGEFLKAMMLGVSSNNGLNPAQQEIAARAVAHFGGMYALRQEPGPGCNFWFDLSLPQPPARAMKGFAPGNTMRCFGAGGALAALAALVREIQQNDRVPAGIDIGAGFDSDLVLSALQHLALQWADEPPARRSERRRIATRLTVLHGFPEMVRATESLTDAASLDFEHAAGIESWMVVDVSEGGFGAIIPPVMGDWIKVGALLGVQTDASPAWGAGMIRRIERDDSRQRRVGIQLLAKTVIPVKLFPAGNGAADEAASAGESALLLSTTPDKHGEVSLLVRAGSGMREHPLEMSVRGKRYHLAPRGLVESKDDFDWVRFKVTGRRAG